mmetsp:Transcript_16050/g.44169  ORF Transcript_16050/g.44169 Transcript_16050/m.44169 type:complete len:205 (-) Transcript_16050:1229-1843(-)
MTSSLSGKGDTKITSTPDSMISHNRGNCALCFTSRLDIEARIDSAYDSEGMCTTTRGEARMTGQSLRKASCISRQAAARSTPSSLNLALRAAHILLVCQRRVIRCAASKRYWKRFTARTARKRRAPDWISINAARRAPSPPPRKRWPGRFMHFATWSSLTKQPSKARSSRRTNGLRASATSFWPSTYASGTSYFLSMASSFLFS